jgi:NTE family protein
MAIKEITVALSGSGFRFPIFIGVLQALEDLNYKIVGIAGTSGGAIISGLYSIGLTPRFLLDTTLSTPLYSLMAPSLLSVWRTKSWNNGKAIEKWLIKYYGETLFSQAKIPIWMTSTDLNSASVFIFNKITTPGTLMWMGARASSSLPFIYPAVQFNSRFLVDGGLCNDLPVNCLPSDSSKIAIHLADPLLPLGSGSSILNIASRLIDTVLYNNVADQVAKVKNVKVVNISCYSISSIDAFITQNDIKQMYQRGYSATYNSLKSGN